MSTVTLQGDDVEGLPRMVAELIQSNTDSDPAKARLLERSRGAVQIDVHDAEVTVGLKFVPGAVTVSSAPVPGADVRITSTADTLLGLSSVPLRFGLPDPLTPEGRAVVRAMLAGRLKIVCLPWRLGMLTTINRLLTVA